MPRVPNALAAVALVAAGCGTRPASDAITACIPAGAVAVARIHLDRLRQAPVYDKLPADFRAIADTYRNAHEILLAWDGAGLLIVTRGTARDATAIAPDLVATGPAESIRAASAQYRTGTPGTPGLVEYATRTSGQSAIWAAMEGGTALPLTGNTRNLNRLFRNLSYAALAANVADSVDLRITALGRTDQAAQEFEESLRAFLSLAAAAESRNPQLATVLTSIQIQRSAATVTASIRCPPETLDTLLQPLTRAF